MWDVVRQGKYTLYDGKDNGDCQANCVSWLTGSQNRRIYTENLTHSDNAQSVCGSFRDRLLIYIETW